MVALSPGSPIFSTHTSEKSWEGPGDEASHLAPLRPSQKVLCYKYLGVQHYNLKWLVMERSHWWNQQQARKILGLQYHQFSMHSSPQSTFLHESIVCVTCETSSWVCVTNLDAHLIMIKHISQLKQKCNTEICTQKCFKSWSNYSYSDLLHLSNLPKVL